MPAPRPDHPREWARRTGLRLRFIYRRRGPSLHGLRNFASLHASVLTHVPSERHLEDRDTHDETRTAALADWHGRLAA